MIKIIIFCFICWNRLIWFPNQFEESDAVESTLAVAGTSSVASAPPCPGCFVRFFMTTTAATTPTTTTTATIPTTNPDDDSDFDASVETGKAYYKHFSYFSRFCRMICALLSSFLCSNGKYLMNLINVLKTRSILKVNIVDGGPYAAQNLQGGATLFKDLQRYMFVLFC